MHFGNSQWKQRPREEQAECEDQTEGDLACKLFKVDQDKFVNALMLHSSVVGINPSHLPPLSLGAVASALTSHEPGSNKPNKNILVVL